MTGSAARSMKGRKKLFAIIVGVLLIVGIGTSVFIFASRPDLTVSLNKSSLLIQRGTLQTLQISIATKNLASGQVSLSTSGLPTNVTASFSNPDPQIQAGGSTESNLTITAGVHAYGQNSTVTITASSNGLTRQAALLIAVVGNTNNYDIGDGLNAAGYRFVRGQTGILNRFGIDATSLRKQINFRIDHKLNSRHSVGTSYTYETNFASYSLPLWGPPKQSGFTGGSFRNPQVMSVNFTSTLSRTLLNEARFGMRRTGTNSGRRSCR